MNLLSGPMLLYRNSRVVRSCRIRDFWHSQVKIFPKSSWFAATSGVNHPLPIQVPQRVFSWPNSSELDELVLLVGVLLVSPRFFKISSRLSITLAFLRPSFQNSLDISPASFILFHCFTKSVLYPRRRIKTLSFA